MKQALLGILLGLFCSASLAARTYDIDVVIFSHLTPETVQSEQWPLVSNDIKSAFDRNVQLADAKPTYQLQREKNVLQRTPGYDVLYSASVRHSWSGNGSSITIPVKNNALAGNITVTLGHYFDVHADLLLTEPTALLQKMDAKGYFTHWNQPTYDFHFLQNRRMRSQELNYLGSPLIGVLIKMNPVSQS